MAPVRGRTLPLILLVTACSLDFTVRPQPADGGSPSDAGIDVDQPGIDADRDSDADASIADAGDATTTDGDAAVDCTALANDVAAKLKAARACTLASGHCTTAVKNQCDCDVVIASGGSAAVASYQSAVSQFKGSGCFLGCTGTCASTANRNCLQSGNDVLCFPPP